MYTLQKLCRLLKTVDAENETNKRLVHSQTERIKVLENDLQYTENEKSLQTNRLVHAQKQLKEILTLDSELRSQINTLEARLHGLDDQAQKSETEKSLSLQLVEKLKHRISLQKDEIGQCQEKID